MKRIPGIKTILIGASFIVMIGSNPRKCYAINLALSATSVALGSVTEVDLNAGFVELSAPVGTYALRVNVTGTQNTPWTLYTRAATANFSSAAGLKPCGSLQWRRDGMGTYTPYTTMDVIAANGTANSRVDVDLKLLTDWQDTPGDYNINIVFTVTQP